MLKRNHSFQLCWNTQVLDSEDVCTQAWGNEVLATETDDLCSDSQNTHRCLGMVTRVCDHSAKGTETGSFFQLVTRQSR